MLSALPPAVGDLIRVDDGTYDEALVSFRDGSQGQEIEIESTNYLGAQITGSLVVSHRYNVVRGFKFTKMKVVAGQAGVTLRQAANITLEWCSFEANTPKGDTCPCSFRLRPVSRV